MATSTNHSEIIALYEASRECVWLRRMINHIQQSCGIGSLESPTIIYEDNAACVTQMQTGYIKSNITKHIAPKLFYPHELQQSGEINILQTKSCDNLADLFKSPYLLQHLRNVFEVLVRGDFGICKIQGEKPQMVCLVRTHHIVFFFPLRVFPMGFS